MYEAALDLINMIKFLLSQVGQVPQIIEHFYYSLPYEFQVVFFIVVVISALGGLIHVLKE